VYIETSKEYGIGVKTSSQYIMYINGQPLLSGKGDSGKKYFIAAGVYDVKIFYAYAGTGPATLAVGIIEEGKDGEDDKTIVMSSIGCSEFSYFRLALLLSILLNLVCFYAVIRVCRGKKLAKNDSASSQMMEPNDSNVIQEGGQVAISASADFSHRKLMDQESQRVMEAATPVILEF
jgi:hypothetical protein